MINLKFLDKLINGVEDKVEAEVTQNLQKLALNVDAAVVMATPVDTGRARGNWIVSLNAPTSYSTVNVSSSGSEAISQGAGVISTAKGDDDIYISNNLVYIQKLNDGHSKQAGKYFVERAVDAAKASMV